MCCATVHVICFLVAHSTFNLQIQYVSNSTALKYKNLFPSITDRNSANSLSLSFTNWSLQIKPSHASYWITQHRIMLNLFGSRGCQPFLVNLSEIRTLKICFKFTSKFHGFASHNANTILSTSLFKFNKFCENFRSNRLNYCKSILSRVS